MFVAFEIYLHVTCTRDTPKEHKLFLTGIERSWRRHNLTRKA